MTRFHVRLFDAATATVREELIDAQSRRTAEERYRAPGLVVLSMRRARSMRVSREPDLDVAWWCRELRTLVSAGMTVVEALQTMHSQSTGTVRAQVSKALVERLQQGKALSDAMHSAQCFPAVLVASVKASERTSSLADTLDEFLLYHDMIERLRKQVVGAAIYPAVVAALGVGIAAFLLLFVIPRFSQIYADMHGTTSAATSALITVSRALADHGALLAALLGSLGIAGIASWKSGQLARLAAWLADRLPMVRDQVDEFRLANLYQSLALMFRGGYPIDEALRHCGSVGLGDRIRAAVDDARGSIATGQRLSTALSDAGLADEVSMRLLSVGERSGNFDRVLQTIAERHARNFATFVERATRLVEPALLLLVALAVGGIVVMMYMPVFDVAAAVR